MRSPRATALFAVALAFLTPARALSANDPYQDYYTLETPHFRIHYAKTLEPVAERAADTLEQVHRRLTPHLGHVPREVTHVLITDDVEAANGSATALPYNTIRLFATAPDDMSPLADYDDWLLELTTHEYTHILHTDNIHGLPALVNSLLGKTLAPNQMQPRWLLEGLAVLEESRSTSGGRNRSAIFDMYLRSDVIEGRIATPDQISHLPRRWPTGNLWYLYGSRFLTFIASVYGEHTMRTVAADYGRQIVPYGINRSIQRATSRTYEELYEAWVKHLERHYGAQLGKAQARGMREGKRLTRHGRVTQRPRFVPPARRRSPSVPELVYYSDDAHGRAGFYRIALPSPDRADPSSRELFARAAGEGSGSFASDGTFVFSSVQPFKRVYSFSDLFALPPGQTAEDGFEPHRQRLTEGQRALDPDVSPDGRKVTFVVNRRGTQYLAIADRSGEGAIGPPRVLVKSSRFDQAYTPRFSPDGRRIAYSAWTRGGYRDIRVVDVDTGAFTEVAHDRALDMQPTWAPDGKTLYFSSDRTGIHNLYAYDLEARKLSQVTNVRTGAFMPEVASDGKSLVYVGYTSDGFDLFGMALDPSSFLEAEPYVDDRPAPPAEPRHTDYPRHPYNAWPTLRPYRYSLAYGPGTYGQTLVVTTEGSDIAGFHGISAALSIDAKQGEPQFFLAYSYNRLPFDMTSTVFRSVTPQRQVRVGGIEPVYPEEFVAFSNTLSYTMPRPFEALSVSATHTVSRYDARYPLGPVHDPQDFPPGSPPQQQMVSVGRLNAGYSNVERYLYSVGPARGLSFSLAADISNKGTASAYDFYAFGYNITRYQPVPWHRDHTLVAHLAGAIAGGDPPNRGVYYVGGLVDLPLSQALSQSIFQGGFMLRGYPPSAYSGRQFHLASLEYRFPLWHIERGVSTLPFFVNRLSGATFLDYGGAFDDLDVSTFPDQLHTGYGLELNLDFTLGYFLPATLKLGYARGGSAEAYPGGKLYMVLSSPF